ncbi:MAG TPA: hypothetical protein VGW74_19380, partial [Propionibacteriaceae bacterium]|nr:hypothetical protein [Propionibacteriaceae bacterium]
MGTQHGGNGDNVPPDGERSPDPELPELPPEWGNVEIPDDLSALADEAEQIRQELLRERREGRRPAKASSPAGAGEPSIGVPLLIMSVAVMITLVSLFAMTWSGSSSVIPDDASTQRPSQLPPVSLADATGREISLTARTPAAIMLVERCDCASLLVATAAAAPQGVTVVAVDRSPPEPPAGLAVSDPLPLLLSDPDGLLRSELDLGPPTGAAAVVLVNRAGQIT